MLTQRWTRPPEGERHDHRCYEPTHMSRQLVCHPAVSCCVYCQMLDSPDVMQAMHFTTLKGSCPHNLTWQATQAARYLPQAEKCTPISLHSTASGIVRLGTSKAAVGSAALQCHSLSLTRQGCSVPMMLAAAADALTATYMAWRHLA